MFLLPYRIDPYVPSENPKYYYVESEILDDTVKEQHSVTPTHKFETFTSIAVAIKEKIGLFTGKPTERRKSPFPQYTDEMEYKVSIDGNRTVHYSFPYPQMVNDSVLSEEEKDIVKFMKKRHIIYEETLLTLATTIIRTDDEVKKRIQSNCLKILSSFYPFIQTVLFTKEDMPSPFPNIIVSSQFDVNQFGTPYFKSMIQTISSKYSSLFYGYCNGDLLFHSSFILALDAMKNALQNHQLNDKVLIVGRRINYDRQIIPHVPTSLSHQDRIITSLASQGYLFQTDAEDYFIFTKDTFPWMLIKDVVIGRPGYDNYLVDYAYHHKEISFVDATNASRVKKHAVIVVMLVHQSDKDGAKAGFRQTPDRQWNLRIIGENWHMGRTEYATWKLERRVSTYTTTLHRAAFYSSFFDDVYLEAELMVMKKYIKPTDVCLQYLHASTSGVLLELCKEVYVVIWNNKALKELQEKYKDEKRMHILYGPGYENKNPYRGVDISSERTFHNYLDVVTTYNLKFTVFVNNGHCVPQIAAIIS